MKTGLAAGQRLLRTAAWSYVGAAVLAMLLEPGLRALLVPLAGPWAGRVYGGSSLSDHAFALSAAVAVCGPLVVAWSYRLGRETYGMLPFLFWWGWWVIAALVSVVMLA